MPAIIGEQRALEMLMFNRSIDAAQAQQWGLVSHVAEPGWLERSVMELAEGLGAGPAVATRQLKRLVKGRTWLGSPIISTASCKPSLPAR
ncbi:hypothetical protein I0E51_09345 [Pseudomonas lalucatii]|nr:hypothetical protein [Pseudomonas lalucatii]